MAMIHEAQIDPPAAVLARHEDELSTGDLIRQLERGGWQRAEAGNLVALLYGLRPSRQGWTVHEIEHLRFLRALVDAGLGH